MKSHAVRRYLELLERLFSAGSSQGPMEDVLNTGHATMPSTGGLEGLLVQLCDAMPDVKLTALEARVVCVYYLHPGEREFEFAPDGTLVNQANTGLTSRMAAKALDMPPRKCQQLIERAERKIKKAMNRW